MRRRAWFLPLLLLTLLYAGVALGPFLAPYSPQRQFRQHRYEPPSLKWIDSKGQWRLWPVFEIAGSQPQPLKLFSAGEPYGWLGMSWRTHLYGVEDADFPAFLLGSDSLGRDLFSRLVHGARFSLTLGLVGIGIALAAGVGLGLLAGYAGGWPDTVIMRLADLFFSLPGLLLVMGIRALFPLDLSGAPLYWLIVWLFALMSWGMIARVVRGQVLTLKEREYVLAARVAGASHWWIVTRHILPFTTGVLLVQASVMIPLFILGEITLSFLGVGVQEPGVSWGSLLAAANSISVIGRAPWLLAPAVAIFVTVLAFNLLADGLQGATKLRRQWL